MNRLLFIVPLAVVIYLSLKASSGQSDDYLHEGEFQLSLVSTAEAEEGKKAVLIRFSGMTEGAGLEVDEFGERIELRVVRRTSKDVTPDFPFVDDSEEFGLGATIVHKAPSSPRLPVEYVLFDGASDQVAYTWTHTSFHEEIGAELKLGDD